MSTMFNRAVFASIAAAFALGVTTSADACPLRRAQNQGRAYSQQGYNQQGAYSQQGDRPYVDGQYADHQHQHQNQPQPYQENRQSFSAEGVPFQSGDMAQVAVRTASLKIKYDVLAEVDGGHEFKVLEVQGPWVGAEIQVDGSPIRGWIHYAQLQPTEAQFQLNQNDPRFQNDPRYQNDPRRLNDDRRLNDNRDRLNDSRDRLNDSRDRLNDDNRDRLNDSRDRLNDRRDRLNDEQRPLNDRVDDQRRRNADRPLGVDVDVNNKSDTDVKLPKSVNETRESVDNLPSTPAEPRDPAVDLPKPIND